VLNFYSLTKKNPNKPTNPKHGQAFKIYYIVLVVGPLELYAPSF